MAREHEARRRRQPGRRQSLPVLSPARRQKSLREKSQCSERFRPSTVPHVLVSDFAVARLRQIYVVSNFFPAAATLRDTCDRLELFDRAALLARQRADCLFETVLDLVVDQCLLACAIAFSTACNCWATSRHGRCVFDHVDDAAQVAFGAPQALNDFGMALMDMMAACRQIPYPPR
jgi:hypothetical protein